MPFLQALVLKSAVVATLKKHVNTAPVEKIKVKSHSELFYLDYCNVCTIHR